MQYTVPGNKVDLRLHSRAFGTDERSWLKSALSTAGMGKEEQLN